MRMRAATRFAILIFSASRCNTKCATPTFYTCCRFPAFRFLPPTARKNRSSSAAVLVPTIPNRLPDFFDIFNIGEGEESLAETVELYIEYKKTHEKFDRAEFLRLASHLKGNYVPSLYTPHYDESTGIFTGITPKYPDVPAFVEKNCITDFDKAQFPSVIPVPFTETVHDRIMLECARGCMRGCRFCQAGIIYRPYRAKKPETLNKKRLTNTKPAAMRKFRSPP